MNLDSKNTLKYSKKDMEPISENNYKKLLEINEAGKIGIWFLDVKNNTWELSDTTQAILGIHAKAEFKLKDMYPAINVEDLEKLMTLRQQVLEKQKDKFDIIFKVKTKESGLKILKSWGLKKTDNEGMISGIYGGIKDITEETRKEQEALTANRYLTVALNANKVALWGTEIGEEKTSESRWYEFLGYKYDKNRGLDHLMWEEILHPQDREYAIKNFKSFMSGTKKEYRDVFRLRRADGTYAYIKTTGHAVELTSEGTPHKIVGVHSDITDVMNMQKALQESQQRLDLLVQNAADTVIQTTLDGKVEFASDNYLLLIGKKDGKTFDFNEYIYSIDRIIIKEQIDRLDIYPHVGSAICRLMIKDGYIWFEWHMKKVFEEEHNRYSIIFVGHDITGRMEAEHRILESEANLRMLVNNAKDLLFRLDNKSNIIYASENAYKVLGLAKNKLVGSNPRVFILAEDNSYMNAGLKHLKKQVGKDFVFNARVVTSEGNRWYEWIGRALEHKGEIICVGRDVTESFIKQNQIESLAKTLDTTLEAVRVTTWDWNIKENKITFSPMLFKMLGRKILPKSEHSFDMLNKWIHPDDLNRILDTAKAKVNSNDEMIEDKYRCQREDGEYVWIQSRGYVTEYDEQGNMSRALGVYILIDEQQKLEDKLKFLAYHDELTGLYNREKITEILEEYAISKNQPRAAGIYLDLDNFKATNDIYGHAVGDILLQSIAKAIQERVDDKGFCSRLAGDEFFIFLPNYKSKQEVTKLTSKLLNFIGNSSSSSIPQEIVISTSAGIVFYPEDTGDVKTLINYSDVAMLQAKEKGKNRYVLYNGKITNEYYKSHRLLHDIRRATKNKEFEMFYQPVIDVNDNKVTEVEALLRWNHPMYGRVLPGDFLHVAELSGEISNISKLTFEIIMKQIKRWHTNMGKKISVSINLSARQLTDVDLSKHLISKMEEFEIAPKYIIFEITETSLLHLVEAAKNNLKNLTDKGCRIALDDFGVEYSSLSMLEKVKFDIIKIDRYFIDNISESFVSKQVISMIYNIAEGLKKRCVVEGIETKEQLRIMYDMGFNNMQGFYFAEPMNIKELEKYLMEHKIK